MGFSPATAIQRPDLGLTLEELDLLSFRDGYIGMKVMPVVDVALQTANFSRVSIADLLKQRDTNRAPGAGYNRQSSNFEQDHYACVEHGVEEPVDDREKKMYAYTIDAEMIAMKRAVHSVVSDLEQRIAAKVFNTATFAPTNVGTAWSNTSASTPVEDVEASWLRVWENSGLVPNAMILNWQVFKNLKNNAEIVDRIKFSGKDDPKSVTTNMLAALFDLKYMYVAGGQFNSANEGQAAALSRIWSSSYAMVCRVAETNDVREPCLGRVFNWTGDGSNPEGTVETYRDETVRSDIIRVRQDTDEKLIQVVAGDLLGNIT